MLCISTVDITIADATPITETHTQTPTLCAGGATGTVTITPAGGTAPYTITPAQTGLTAGLHTFTITDANGCILTVDITIADATPIDRKSTHLNSIHSPISYAVFSITKKSGI